MAQHLIQNGQNILVGAHMWDDDSLLFAGTSGTVDQIPTVTFTGPDTLTGITDSGSGSITASAAINLMPGGALVTAGLIVNDATLSISERPGTSVIFNGTSLIGNRGTLTATGFAGQGNYTVNGTLTIDGTSTVNMDYVTVGGAGTFQLTGPNALLRAGSVGASETVKLNGGMLSLSNGMTFLGTIGDSTPGSSRIGLHASVAVFNAMTAVRETFDLTTGVLNLFDAAGGELVNLKFAGSGALYATPTQGLATNYIAITSQPTAGTLVHTFSV